MGTKSCEPRMGWLVVSVGSAYRNLFCYCLPRTTERPVRKRGDEPRSKFATRKPCVALPEQLERGECSGVLATLWSNLSTETAHVSRGSYSTGQSHGRKPVVRGLPQRLGLSKNRVPENRGGLSLFVVCDRGIEK